MTRALNWIAGAAVLGATSLTGLVVNEIVRGPADYGPLAAEQDRVIIDLRARLSNLQTGAEARMDALEMDLDTLKMKGYVEQEQERVVREMEKLRHLRSSEGASLFKSAPKAEAEKGKTAERLLIEAENERYRQRQRVDLMKQLLVEHGIDHADVSGAAKMGPKVASAPYVSLDEAANAEAWVRGLVEQAIAETEADIARLEQTAAKLETMLVEKGIDPKTGVLTNGRADQ